MRTSLYQLIETIRDRDWKESEYGMIRCASGLCPLVAGALEINPGKFYGLLPVNLPPDADLNSFYTEAAQAIGYRGNPGYLATAADEPHPEIRSTRPREIRRQFVKLLQPEKETA